MQQPQRPTAEDQAVIEQFLDQPSVKTVFINTPANIERLFKRVKGCVGEYKIISIQNLKNAFQGYIRCEDYTIVRLSPAKLAALEERKRKREVAAQLERDRNDPVLQTRLKAQRELEEKEQQARREQEEKEYWRERSKLQLSENSLQALQRLRREKIAAGLAVPSIRGGDPIPKTW